MDTISNMLTENRTHNPILLGPDAKELAKYERSRQLEELRKKRIFNHKNRLIGVSDKPTTSVDVETLEIQKREKLDRERFEQLENEKFDLLSKRLAEAAIEKEILAKHDRRRVQKDIENYRLIHQKKEFGRDYDLEVPLNVKESGLSGDDTRFGVTIFAGEDDDLQDRIKRQKHQQKLWLLQQMHERYHAKKQSKNADLLYQDGYIARDKRSLLLEKLESDCRIKIDRANAEYNAALAKKKREEKLHENEKERQYNELEMLNTVTSDLLQENPDLAKSALGPTRINTIMYKGMSDEMKREILATQQQQIQENKEQKEKQDYEMECWNKYDKYVLDVTNSAEREKEMKLLNLKKELEEYNIMLGKRQKEANAYTNNVIYANQITDNYFTQFNKGSR